MTIQKLESSFIGLGEVKGYLFNKHSETDLGYIYKVTSEEQAVHYEVFKKKNTPLCIDFNKRIYSETDFKELYPKANVFGVWAWTCGSIDRATSVLNSLN